MTFGDLLRQVKFVEGMKLEDLLTALKQYVNIDQQVVCRNLKTNNIIKSRENLVPFSHVDVRNRFIDYKNNTHVFFDISKRVSMKTLTEQLKRAIELRYYVSNVSVYNIHKTTKSKHDKTFCFFVESDDPKLFLTVQKKRFYFERRFIKCMQVERIQ